MYEVENRLRARVAESLSSEDDDWWTSRIPSSIAAKAEARRAAERESPAAGVGSMHPIMYLELGELADVIRDENNWRPVFGVRFALDRAEFDDALRRVTSVRNKTAHNRPLTGVDVELLRDAARHLGLLETAAAPTMQQ
jgi:hypothetical protein